MELNLVLVQTLATVGMWECAMTKEIYKNQLIDASEDFLAAFLELVC